MAMSRGAAWTLGIALLLVVVAGIVLILVFTLGNSAANSTGDKHDAEHAVKYMEETARSLDIESSNGRIFATMGPVAPEFQEWLTTNEGEGKATVINLDETETLSEDLQVDILVSSKPMDETLSKKPFLRSNGRIIYLNRLDKVSETMALKEHMRMTKKINTFAHEFKDVGEEEDTLFVLLYAPNSGCDYSVQSVQQQLRKDIMLAIVYREQDAEAVKMDMRGIDAMSLSLAPVSDVTAIPFAVSRLLASTTARWVVFLGPGTRLTHNVSYGNGQHGTKGHQIMIPGTVTNVFGEICNDELEGYVSMTRKFLMGNHDIRPMTTAKVWQGAENQDPWALLDGDVVTTHPMYQAHRTLMRRVHGHPVFKDSVTMRAECQVPQASRYKHKLVVFTAQFGARDLLKRQIQQDGVKFVCFTDTTTSKTSNGWEIVQVDNIFEGKVHDYKRRMARYIKTQPWSFLDDMDAPFAMWVDGTIFFRKPPLEALKAFIPDPAHYVMGVKKHPFHETLQHEFDTCRKLNMDSQANFDRQEKRYADADIVPQNTFVLETPLTVRKNCLLARKISDDWWGEITNYTVRDQLSLPFVLLKNKAVEYTAVYEEEMKMYNKPNLQKVVASIHPHNDI